MSLSCIMYTHIEALCNEKPVSWLKMNNYHHLANWVTATQRVRCPSVLTTHSDVYRHSYFLSNTVCISYSCSCPRLPQNPLDLRLLSVFLSFPICATDCCSVFCAAVSVLIFDVTICCGCGDSTVGRPSVSCRLHPVEQRPKPEWC